MFTYNIYIYIQLYTYSYGYVSSCQFFFWYLKFSSCKTMFWHWPLRRCQQLYFASRCPCAWSISFSSCMRRSHWLQCYLFCTRAKNQHDRRTLHGTLQSSELLFATKHCCKNKQHQGKNQEQFLLRLSWHRLDSLWCIPYQNSFLVIPSDFRAIVNGFLWFG